ncbi:MAG: type IX secretion system membrane protein PorP/SprF [Elusimicrobia bacterium]|nr:type IX secretion system membrane protein PorP/SprF [Elusimicrobiota bacterium]
MSRKARVVMALLLAVLPAAVPARAAYEDVGVSARATGLGQAYTAVADDAYAVYYNPAGLATLDRKEFATTYSRLLTGLSDGSNLQNSFLSYVQPLDGGRNGTLGTAWNYMTLDSLYRESSLFASYGRRLSREDHAPLYGGVSLKFLDRSLGGTSAASNSVSDSGYVSNNPDPVLQHASKSNFDADLGLLYRPRPNWNLGLQIQHLLEPNVAFLGSDKLQRNYKLGAAYRTPFTTLSTDLDFLAAPDGSTDKNLSIAAEKWLPTLLYGSFAIRGGLGVGTRDYRNVSVGLSYRIHRMQFDYGFSIPVGGLTGTTGTQRLGLTWRFGAPRAESALLGEMLLENLSTPAPVGSPEFNKQAAKLVAYKRKAIDALMRDADAQANLGHFERAHESARQAASLAPRDPVLADLDGRYRTAAAYFPDISAVISQQGGARLEDGLMKFIAGKDKEALASLENARLLAPSTALDGMINILEAKVGTLAPAVPTPTASVPAQVAVSTSAAPAVAVSTGAAQAETAEQAAKRILDATTALLEVSFFQQDWKKVVELGKQVVAIDPANVHAYERMAGAYHAMGDHADALKSVEAAYALESDPVERAKLKAYIGALKAVLAKERRPEKRRAASAASPEQVERLYEAGVELYAQGRLIEAREAFRRCLELDAKYMPAQRAFARVQAEMMQSGQGQ